MASAPTFTREMLSTHETIARYRGLETGRESMLRVYPQRKDRQWAVFDIEEYLGFERPGEYGDERQSTFKIVADDPTNLSSALHLAQLTEGARVRLSWTHWYVTRSETGADGRPTSASYPERAVTRLEPA